MTTIKPLNALYDTLKARFDLYCEIFEPLHQRAYVLGHQIPEIHEDGFSDDWGNSGLRSMFKDEESGFTFIYTDDYFHGGWGVILSRIPSKYLHGDEECMKQDAIRIKSTLDELQKLHE